LQGTISSPQQELNFRLTGNGEIDMMRWFGCAIICRTPDIGIKEVIQKLYEYYNFYQDIENYKIEKQDRTKSIGNFTASSKSPELVISE
jgi:hypothetical protein